MATIIPYVSKQRVPEGWHHPLHFNDLEDCFRDLSRKDVRLSVHFAAVQSPEKEERDRIRAEGRYLVATLDYNPDPKDLRYAGWTPEELRTLVLVMGTVYPVPSEETRAAGVDHSWVRAVLHQQIHQMIPRGLPTDRWWLRIRLLIPERVVECVSQEWTGIRAESERTIRIPINEDVARTLIKPASTVADDPARTQVKNGGEPATPRSPTPG